MTTEQNTQRTIITKSGKKVTFNDVSEEKIQKAEDIIQTHVDSKWDIDNRGCMYIGVTGKRQVYYTLWRYNPRNIYSPLNYMGNLSTDIIKAAQKAKRIAGIQPLFFENYDTIEGMMGAREDVFTFGKYRGRTVGEIYVENVQYLIWLSKNFTPRNKKQDRFLDVVKDFVNSYFKSIADKNRVSDDKEYLEAKNFEGSIKIKSITFKDTDFGMYFVFKGETEKYRFHFSMTPNKIAKWANIEIEYKFENTPHGNVNQVISRETIDKLRDTVEKIVNTNIEIKGKIKGHKEIMGKKYTMLNYVKIK